MPGKNFVVLRAICSSSQVARPSFTLIPKSG